jgi:hypothetical protein
MLGCLEEAVSDPSQAVVVLPANEYINDQCINDPKSALGAFVQSKFPGKTKEFETLIQLALTGKAAAKVTNGVNTINAYGLGTTVYLDRPLNEGHKILIAAATTDRAAEGLRGDISALIAIVRAANGAAKERRMAEVILPLIGAGHGSICPGCALLV